MDKYGVELPVAGYIYLETKANSEKEAIKKALNMPWTDEDIMELDAYEKTVEGNVCHIRAQASAIKIRED